MLKNIEYIFPRNSENEKLFHLFFNLFGNLPYSKILNENSINIISSNLNPKTVFKLSNDIDNIQINIENPKYLNLFNRYSKYEKKPYGVKRVSLDELLSKLSGHVTRVDHTGINLLSSLYTNEEWYDFLNYISSVSNIYSYPTGEPWPFLIPSTFEEQKNEIMDFTILREPRLELVYDNSSPNPTLHIDIETNLSKQEVENLFPGNKGIYFNTLENIFKAIYLDYNSHIDIRFDIRFKCIHNDFESGEWFVNYGKRLL